MLKSLRFDSSRTREGSCRQISAMRSVWVGVNVPITGSATPRATIKEAARALSEGRTTA
jgi:hypothetical protein